MRVMKPDGFLKEPTVYPLPQLHDLTTCCGTAEQGDDCEPIRVFAGSRHTVILRSCGRLWASGWSAHGQLGDGQKRNKLAYLDSFQALPEMPCDKECQIICGPWATLLAIAE